MKKPEGATFGLSCSVMVMQTDGLTYLAYFNALKAFNSKAFFDAI